MSGQLPHNESKSIQIISNQNGKFILNESVLRDILLDQSTQNKPVRLLNSITQ